MTIPGRTWTPPPPRRHAVVIEETTPGDTGIELWIGEHDGLSALLDVTQTRELVSDLLRRLLIIAGRRAAIEAAADASHGAARAVTMSTASDDLADSRSVFQWAVMVGVLDADHQPTGLVIYDELAAAEEHAQYIPDCWIARRTVLLSPWELDPEADVCGGADKADEIDRRRLIEHAARSYVGEL